MSNDDPKDLRHYDFRYIDARLDTVNDALRTLTWRIADLGAKYEDLSADVHRQVGVLSTRLSEAMFIQPETVSPILGEEPYGANDPDVYAELKRIQGEVNQNRASQHADRDNLADQLVEIRKRLNDVEDLCGPEKMRRDMDRRTANHVQEANGPRMPQDAAHKGPYDAGSGVHDIGWAVAQLRAGKMVRRRGWKAAERNYCVYDHPTRGLVSVNVLTDSVTIYAVPQHELYATDWELAQ